MVFRVLDLKRMLNTKELPVIRGWLSVVLPLAQVPECAVVASIEQSLIEYPCSELVYSAYKTILVMVLPAGIPLAARSMVVFP